MFSNSKKLGQFLKEKRLESQLSQGKVAKKLKYTSPQFISNWERGISSPPLNKINDLISLYGLSKKEIVQLILEETKSFLEKNISDRRQARASR